MAGETEMSDGELLTWLSENGTDISREELEAGFPRVLAAIERSELVEVESYRGWFGESWGAPINLIQPHLATPEDEDCIFCHEPILASDQGYIMPFSDVDGLKRVAAHKRCQHRALGLKV